MLIIIRYLPIKAKCKLILYSFCITDLADLSILMIEDKQRLKEFLNRERVTRNDNMHYE